VLLLGLIGTSLLDKSNGLRDNNISCLVCISEADIDPVGFKELKFNSGMNSEAVLGGACF
jgi:hypothetical protein